MVNYYKQFETFKQQQEHHTKIPLSVFEQRLMIFFGFGGRNKTLARWLHNFEDVGFIKLYHDSDMVWFVDIL